MARKGSFRAVPGVQKAIANNLGKTPSVGGTKVSMGGGKPSVGGNMDGKDRKSGGGAVGTARSADDSEKDDTERSKPLSKTHEPTDKLGKTRERILHAREIQAAIRAPRACLRKFLPNVKISVEKRGVSQAEDEDGAQ